MNVIRKHGFVRFDNDSAEIKVADVCRILYGPDTGGYVIVHGGWWKLDELDRYASFYWKRLEEGRIQIGCTMISVEDILKVQELVPTPWTYRVGVWIHKKLEAFGK